MRFLARFCAKSFLLPAIELSLFSFVFHKSNFRSQAIASNLTPILMNFELNMQLLDYVDDKYDGVIIKSETLPSDPSIFSERLLHSLDEWRKLNRRGVWLKIPIEQADYIGPAVKCGFVFHHAEKEYVMLTHWLSEEENRLPANASHQVGVGAVVFNEGKLLLVQEKSGPLRGTGIWKIPTGLVDSREDIPDAAVREVFEETGIKTEFKSLISIRQAHNAAFGKSDLFFVCVLNPLSKDIKIQEDELVACEWLNPDIYLQQERFAKSPIYGKINKLIENELIKINEKSTTQGMIGEVLPIGFGRTGNNVLFYFNPDDNSEKKI